MPFDLSPVLEAYPLQFTTAQAQELLVRREALRQRVVHGSLRRLAPGVLIPTARWDALNRFQQHLVETAAYLQTYPDGWHAARRTAGLVHGLPLLGALPAKPQLVRDRTQVTDRGSLRSARVTPLPSSDRTMVGPLPVTSLARTVIDIARDGSVTDGLVACDAALRQGLDPEELNAVLRRCARWPGSRQAADVVGFADGRAENAFESLSRLAFRTLGLPVPEPQVEIWVGGTLLARVDFLWREQLVVGEADGRMKYTSTADFYAEKRREEGLRNLGFEVVRWDWHAAYRPNEEFRNMVGRSLARGLLNTLRDDVRLVSTGTRT